MMMTKWKARKTKMIVTNLAMTKVCSIVSVFAYFFRYLFTFLCQYNCLFTFSEDDGEMTLSDLYKKNLDDDEDGEDFVEGQ